MEEYCGPPSDDNSSGMPNVSQWAFMMWITDAGIYNYHDEVAIYCIEIIFNVHHMRCYTPVIFKMYY